jgi:hypothetical protein
MENFTYCFLDYLPQVPAELLTDFEQYKNNKREVGIVGFVSTGPDGTKYNQTDYQRFNISGKLLEWLQFNITRNALDYGAGFTVPPSPGADHIKHIDYSRDYSLNYQITTGGDNVLTQFYKEKGQPLYRKQLAIDVAPKDLTTYILSRELELVDSVCVPVGRWVLLNTKAIHEAVNLTSSRIAIQISLDINNKFISQE